MKGKNRTMKRTQKLLLIIAATLLNSSHTHAQKIAIKANLAHIAIGTANIGLELAPSSKITLALDGTYNSWSTTNDYRKRIMLVQPEIRLWSFKKYVGSFVGFHLHLAEFNLSKISEVGLKNHRIEGNAYGVGISWGYNLVLTTHLNIETNLGIGYSTVKYEKFKCEKCSDRIEETTLDLISPTRVGVSLVYLLK